MEDFIILLYLAISQGTRKMTEMPDALRFDYAALARPICSFPKSKTV